MWRIEATYGGGYPRRLRSGGRGGLARLCGAGGPGLAGRPPRRGHAQPGPLALPTPPLGDMGFVFLEESMCLSSLSWSVSKGDERDNQHLRDSTTFRHPMCQSGSGLMPRNEGSLAGISN